MAGRHEISAGAALVAGAGAVTVWAAMKGVSLGSGVRALLSGHTLPAGEDLTIGSGSDLAAAGGGAVVSDSAIVAAASRYLGTGSVYRWAGGNPNGWDCSGFVNWTLNHDLGLAIPGYAPGTFTGKSHGPVTAQWAVWSGLVVVPRDQVQAGDLVIWPARHMGIAINNTQMINAPGPNGTPAPVIGRINGAAPGPLWCRRLKGGL